jgi:MEMO1 family protein
MSQKTVYLLVLFILLPSIGSCQTSPKIINRPPAVAGAFYPGDSAELRSMLTQLFHDAVPMKQKTPIAALIVPHAGYVYSGGVAASGFNQIDPASGYENIFIIGSSHRVAFDGASVYDQGNFITPLGMVYVNTSIGKTLVKEHSIFTDRMDVHKDEHSIEVQLPFLQYHLKKDFQIVPIIIGGESPEISRKVGEALRPYFNSKNLFVISSDFSHYPSYEDAVKTDKKTASAIESNSFKMLLSTLQANEDQRIPGLATSLCGWTSVLALLSITEEDPMITYRMIEYKNSGDAAVGDKSRVVGYNAIIATRSGKNEDARFTLTDQDKQDLLSIARRTIEQYLINRTVQEIDASGFSSTIKTPCGAFVTLHENKELRGCIGRFDATEPLYKVVERMAIASSTEDYRFQPVTADETGKLEIEISVLTPMQKIKSIDEIQLGKHGIYIKKGSRSGTFLPQVATETGWTKEEYLGHCAQDKAGIGWDGWKDAEIFTYEALVFSERDFIK